MPPGAPARTTKRRVRLEFFGPGRLPDPDNLLKSCLDAMVKCGMLVDDSVKWCECSATCVRGPLRTLITLEDVP